MGDTGKCALRKKKSTPDTPGSTFAGQSCESDSHFPRPLHLAWINHAIWMVIHDCRQLRWVGYYFRIDVLEQVVDRPYVV
jgi:hypothetical protein